MKPKAFKGESTRLLLSKFLSDKFNECSRHFPRRAPQWKIGVHRKTCCIPVSENMHKRSAIQFLLATPKGAEVIPRPPVAHAMAPAIVLVEI